MVEATKEYVQNVSRRTPGLIIFLIDQSSSMDGSIFTQSGKNYTKAMVVADCVNRWILELLGKCCAGAEFRNLLGFTFIGYSTEISSALPAIDLSRYPIVASELAKSYITKNDGDQYDLENNPKPKFTWILPIASGSTNMTPALDKAYEIANNWTKSHMDSFPPIIINITDGLTLDPNNPDVLEKSGVITGIGDKIKSIRTNYGHSLILNYLIGSVELASVKFPLERKEVSELNFVAGQLFDMSSVVPDVLIDDAKGYNLEIKNGARFFFYNYCDTPHFIFQHGARPAPREG